MALLCALLRSLRCNGMTTCAPLSTVPTLTPLPFPTEWQDAVADVADTLGVEPDTLKLPTMPTPDYVTLHIPQPPEASTSTAASASADDSDVPPPPPPPAHPDDGAASATAGPEEDADSAQTGEKRKASSQNDKSDDRTTTKAARTETAPSNSASASSVNRIFTVLKEEDLKHPELPSLKDLEKFLIEKQKEELLKEFA